jgi:hypothetical protein
MSQPQHFHSDLEKMNSTENQTDYNYSTTTAEAATATATNYYEQQQQQQQTEEQTEEHDLERSTTSKPRNTTLSLSSTKATFWKNALINASFIASWYLFATLISLYSKRSIRLCPSPVISC